MPAILRKHISHDPARRNRIHRDLLRSAILCETSREAFDSGFRPGIQGVVLHPGHAGCDGRGEYNSPAIGTVLEPVLRNEELASRIEIENAVEIFLCDILLDLESFHTGIRNNEIESAKVREGLLEQGADFSGFGNVGLDGNGAGAEGAELADDAFGGRGGFAVVDYDEGAAGAEFKGYAFADAAACSCDEGDFAVETAFASGGVGCCVAVLHCGGAGIGRNMNSEDVSLGACTSYGDYML